MRYGKNDIVDGTLKTIKEIIKRLLVYAFGKSASMIRLNERCRVVSFDLFDTLIFRKVQRPQDIFLIVEKKYESISGNGNWYSKQRVEAERRARERAKGAEITINDIYENMDQFNATDLDMLKKLEQETEIEMCEPNVEMVDFFLELQNKGYHVIIVTDMYLGKGVIETILAKCKLNGYERLFISSEVGKSKRQGGLFDYIMREMLLDSSEIVHMGDNPLGDWLVPKRRGIKAFLYKRDDRRGKNL